MGGTAADILVYTGAVLDGDWDTAGNWAVAAGSPTTTTPSAGEGVVLDDRTVYPITQAPGSGVALTGFNVTAGCKHGIGTPGTSLTNVTVDSGSAGKFTFAAGVHCYFNGSIDILEVNNTGAGGFHYTGGTATVAEVAAGLVEIQSGATATMIYTTGASAKVLGQSGCTFTALEQYLGDVASDVSIATAFVGGGRLRLMKSAGSTTLTVAGNGYVNLQTDGTITTLNGKSGRLDANGSRRSSPTITTANYRRRVFRLFKQYDGGEITVTNDNGAGVDGLSVNGGGGQLPFGGF